MHEYMYVYYMNLRTDQWKRCHPRVTNSWA